MDQQSSTAWGNGWKRHRVCATKTWQSLCQTPDGPLGTVSIRFCCKYYAYKSVCFFFGDVLKRCNKMLCYTCFSAWTGSYRSRREAQWAVWRTSEKRLPRPNFSWDDTFVLFWLSLLTSLFYPVSSKQMFPSFPELAEVLCVTSESLCHSVACSNNERYSLVTSGTVLLFWSTCINIEVLRKNNQELWSVWSVWGGKRRKIKLLLTS